MLSIIIPARNEADNLEDILDYFKSNLTDLEYELIIINDFSDDNTLNKAQKLKEMAENKLKEYNKIIEDSKKEAKKIIEDNKRKLDTDIENKKLKFDEEIEKELLLVEKEINSLKKDSVTNVNKIAVEISSEIIKKIMGTELNKSSIVAIVENIAKKRGEKYL